MRANHTLRAPFIGRGPLHVRALHICLLALAARLLAAVPAGAAPVAERPLARAAATCSDFANQPAAQRAANPRDADGDGVYCETLPCRCLTPGDGGGDPTPPAPNCS